MSEKTTDEIEEKLNEEVNTTENEESGTIMIRIKNTTNMKAIKKQLSKGTSYQSIEEVESEVNGVIQSYYKKNLIDEETKEEYDLLISNLFKVRFINLLKGILKIKIGSKQYVERLYPKTSRQN